MKKLTRRHVDTIANINPSPLFFGWFKVKGWRLPQYKWAKLSNGKYAVYRGAILISTYGSMESAETAVARLMNVGRVAKAVAA